MLPHATDTMPAQSKAIWHICMCGVLVTICMIFFSALEKCKIFLLLPSLHLLLLASFQDSWGSKEPHLEVPYCRSSVCLSSSFPHFNLLPIFFLLTRTKETSYNKAGNLRAQFRGVIAKVNRKSSEVRWRPDTGLQESIGCLLFSELSVF